MQKIFCLLICLILTIPVTIFAQEELSSPKSSEDLQRFTGLYGDPEEKNENRRLWVMVSCDGHLVAGALWGDVAPWWLKEEAGNIFTYEDSFFKLRLEFETDNEGNVVGMNHDLTGMKKPLNYLAPIPEDWDPCLERPKR